MCYAIPGKIIEIKDKKVTVEYFGERKTAHNEYNGLKLGDYIYAQGGFVIKTIPKYEAEAILATWKETFFELQALDLRLSRIDLEKSGVSRRLSLILDKALEEMPLQDSDYLYLLELENKKELELLYKAANFLRHKHHSNSCCVHGIVEISNYCKNSCGYCGISKNNIKINRYRMSLDEIYDAAYEAVEKYGFKALVLQSGEDAGYSVPELAKTIKKIRSELKALIFISFGEVGIPALEEYYKAGARGLLMRFETSNPEIFSTVCGRESLESRISQIKAAYKMGYLIATGGLIGLPNQTSQDLLEDIKLTKELHAEMYSFGPFIPHPETPLKDIASPNPETVLKVIAVSRLIDPKNAKILVTTGFETLFDNARRKGLSSGANSIMLNVTPEKFRKLYSIYPKRAHENESIQEQIDSTLTLLKNLGRAPTDLSVSQT